MGNPTFLPHLIALSFLRATALWFFFYSLQYLLVSHTQHTPNWPSVCPPSRFSVSDGGSSIFGCPTWPQVNFTLHASFCLPCAITLLNSRWMLWFTSWTHPKSPPSWDSQTPHVGTDVLPGGLVQKAPILPHTVLSSNILGAPHLKDPCLKPDQSFTPYYLKGKVLYPVIWRNIAQCFGNGSTHMVNTRQISPCLW